ncbi:MAG: peptidylprolyl isomerase [Kiritimatiellales bacterium]|nr:peptidylprolyl isomerase [Kiritimatiellota bacterium]MBL7011413.1 peptidylprolyl isomerase [Kiritimatiellales bacterium]
MMTTKRASLFIAAAVLVALTAGCSKENPATEEIDLTQAPDLFEQPLQPNPLALAAADVVVTVEGEDITHGEIMQAVQATMAQLSRQMPPQQLSQMYGEVYQNMTETLIANILLENAAESSSLAVSDAELNEEIATIKAGAPEGQSLEDTLAANGVAFDEWKENLRSQMLVGKLVEEKTDDVPEATLAEAASFYQENIDSFKVPETVAASHILIAFTPEDTDETKAEKKAELAALKAQIDAGASFEELAGSHSDCPSSQRGGTLGTFGRGQMVPAFEEAAFSMDTGAVSDIVETQFGYHLIKVTDHQPEGVRPLSEVTEQLTDYLTGQKKQEAMLAYIETLKESANIVMQKQDLDAGIAK